MSVATAAAMQAYKQVGNQGISSDRLVLLGLEGILEYIRRARLAIQTKDLSVKADSMDKAYQLTAHLLASVNFEQGGEIAKNLDSLYRFLLNQLAQANIFDDLQALDACQPVLVDLRDAWRGLLGHS
ncbi:flagellar export chaperone FliS [Acidithiobacillus thiooxidans]|jgi:flagellar protein FliS|uniref:Flagellar secretion chaperone FliS n=2 Tax=Acidithiobacillus thiooxidans TaxID=930 RepID=A0A1C2I1A3_ACITH|nr:MULTISPECIES: flagellar export chaperone FliS [Acidithiobacillus]MBE7565534.1 flagellar export chaperone FliS [Acidithiobacillus sp. HP-11]MBU2742707.1 flagellar export chaperone FliS [Acidithiobacillus albertensis]MBU2749470.1 flagellar export chaperone FliS [Acidithiobacillus thiooxidans]MBU2792087.1 flagellar export chaperone FliS [Acidithiobacillus thiooxidans]MBU2834806.1 flagellar export chaperone FliS [Acidithiobacillus thiooxidans]